MGNTSDKRLKKLAEGYTKLLAEGDVTGFNRAWDERMQVWLREILRRVELHRRPERFCPSPPLGDRRSTVNAPKAEIFGVLDSANRLLNACGSAVEAMVGEETRATLRSACAKGVACVYDRRLYRPVKTDLYDRKY